MSKNISEQILESIVQTYAMVGYILSEEDLTSPRARKAASKAAVHMDTTHETNVRREMAKEHIRTGKDASRAKAQEKAVENDPDAPASAKRAVAANKAARKMFRGVKPVAPQKDPKRPEKTRPDYIKMSKKTPGFGVRRQGDVKAAVQATKGASPEPLDKANRTVQRVIDRETRASRVGFGPKEGQGTADRIKRGREAAVKKAASKAAPKGAK